MKTTSILKGLAATLLLTVLCIAPAAASTGESIGTNGLLALGVGALAFGLVVNEQTLGALKINFLTLFNNARSAYQPQWTKGAMDIPSTTSLNTYAWMADFPKMREWLGDRQYKALKAERYDIINKTFESSVRIPRESIEDDQYGIFSPRFTAMGMAAEMLWDDLFFAVMNDGFSTVTSFDGKTFFSTTHASGANKLSGGSSALSSTSFADAVKLIRTQKDTKGDPLFSGNEPLTLWVPPALEEGARLLLNADFISVSGGSTQNNIWKNAANLVVSAKLKSATAWFLTMEFMGLKPFIVQKRRLPDFRAIESPDDVVVRTKNEFEYLTDARGNAGPGLHQLAVGSVGA